MTTLDTLMAAGTAVSSRPRTFEAILWGGLAAAVFDATYAMSVWALRGVAPDRVWQGVASGLLGRESFQGGWRTAALGIAIHFFIALTAAAVYVTASRFLTLLLQRPVLCGIAYGFMVYGFMNYVVIPLSALRPGSGHATGWNLLGGLAIHAFGVGLPIALASRRFAGAPS